MYRKCMIKVMIFMDIMQLLLTPTPNGATYLQVIIMILLLCMIACLVVCGICEDIKHKND